GAVAADVVVAVGGVPCTTLVAGASPGSLTCALPPGQGSANLVTAWHAAAPGAAVLAAVLSYAPPTVASYSVWQPAAGSWVAYTAATGVRAPTNGSTIAVAGSNLGYAPSLLIA